MPISLWLRQGARPLAVCSASLPAFLISRPSEDGHCNRSEASDAEHLSSTRRPPVCLTQESVDSCPNWLVFCFVWYEFLAFFDIKLLLDMLFATISSHSVTRLYILLLVSFSEQKRFRLICSYLFTLYRRPGSRPSQEKETQKGKMIV